MSTGSNFSKWLRYGGNINGNNQGSNASQVSLSTALVPTSDGTSVVGSSVSISTNVVVKSDKGTFVFGCAALIYMASSCYFLWYVKEEISVYL
jgi:hypothetical protein